MYLKDSSTDLINVLVVFGSPHTYGYTAELLDHFISFLPENVILHKISAYNLNVLPCTDCGYCRENDGCVNSDLDEYDKLYRNADIVIFATPVYNLSFPSPLKSIIDRSQRYFNARFCRNIKPVIKKPKKAVLLATCGSDNSVSFKNIELSLKQMFTVMNTELCGSVLWCATDSDFEKHKKSAFENAGILCENIIK